MPVDVSTRGLGRSPGISRATVRRHAEAMLAAVGRSASYLSVVLCDDATIAELNGSYRNRPEPTDVLSFGQNGAPADGAETPTVPAPRPGRGEPELLGDVVISVPFAARQAPDGLRREVVRLLAHGLLHLLGWDHETAATRRAMNHESDRLVRAAGA
jgi:probable rRNA maturation factor